MDSEEDFLRHYHRAVAAGKEGDLDTAIAELDLFLCSDPPADAAMVGWFNLNTFIIQKFRFPERDGQTLSDEEYMWQRRAEVCLEKVVELYEDAASRAAASDAPRKLYERAKDRLARTSHFGELVRDRDGAPALRSSRLYFSVMLPPLGCLAEKEREASEKMKGIYERNTPLKGGLWMQDVARYLKYGLNLAEENEKEPAAAFLTKVVDNLEESDPQHRKILPAVHLRLAALQSDLGNNKAAVRHAEWVLKNEPPESDAHRMMMETVLRMNGRNVEAARKRPSAVGTEASKSGGGCLSLAAIVLLTAVTLVRILF